MQSVQPIPQSKDYNIRVYNRHRIHPKTGERLLQGTFLYFKGCLARIKLDYNHDNDIVSWCVPADYAICHDNDKNETKLLSDLPDCP